MRQPSKMPPARKPSTPAKANERAPAGAAPQDDGADKRQSSLFVGSTEKAFQVLHAFDGPQRFMTLADIARASGLDRSAAQRLVHTLETLGYIKRVPLSTYRAQKRGGKGRSGMATRDEDFVARLFVANTHTPVLFFSSEGQVYKEKVWRLPLAAPNAKGKALVNMLPLDKNERITTIMPLPEDETTWENLDVMFSTTR
eukprot:gene52983-64726_t